MIGLLVKEILIKILHHHLRWVILKHLKIYLKKEEIWHLNNPKRKKGNKIRNKKRNKKRINL